jgi:DNA-binding protein HU-beta
MNKTEMVAKLAEKNGMTKASAQKALKGVIDIISDELKGGGNVVLTGFGTFSVAERKARKGRNPQNGKLMNIAASRVPKFKAGKVLKDMVA